ncbi:MAG: pyridoxal phosphate-dependent decarboxylase family protein [Alphaproteobacteria bacterium]
MDNQEFRRSAHELVDWMARYLENIESYPVRSQARPGEISARLPEVPPVEGEPVDRIMRDFEDVVLPGITHWQHPSFFAYFPANSSPPSVLAEMLTATLAAQCMSWQTSPAATELETRVMDWLRRMIGLPEGFAGVIQDTASSATLAAILSARERATGWRSNESGLSDQPAMTVYASSEAHSSIDKAVRIAGLGQAGLRKVAVDETFALTPELLAQAVEADLSEGRRPICVVATVGTTGASGFDPLGPIGEICAKHGIWLHVDAAWAGSALVLPETRWMIEGIERADSFVFNPHKWLFTNFDCSAHYVRDPDALTRTFAVQPEYLRTAADDVVINYRDWGVPLGRRFRALKLWFVIRAYGVDGLRERIAAHIHLAREAARKIETWEDFELLAPARLALFCFRYRPRGVDDPAQLDRLNEQLLERLNESGALYLTHARVNGAVALRFSVGQRTTEARHVEAALARIRETAATLRSESPGRNDSV